MSIGEEDFVVGVGSGGFGECDYEVVQIVGVYQLELVVDVYVLYILGWVVG